MWSSFEKPAGFAQQQANVLANAQDELKTLSPELADGVAIQPEVTFEVVNGKAKPIVLWKVTSPTLSLLYATLPYAIGVAQALNPTI